MSATSHVTPFSSISSRRRQIHTIDWWVRNDFFSVHPHVFHRIVALHHVPWQNANHHINWVTKAATYARAYHLWTSCHLKRWNPRLFAELWRHFTPPFKVTYTHSDIPLWRGKTNTYSQANATFFYQFLWLFHVIYWANALSTIKLLVL